MPNLVKFFNAKWLNMRVPVILLLFLCFMAFTAYSQDAKKAQKAMEKEWATKLKQLKPMDYKAQVEELEKTKAALLEQSQQADKLKAEVEPIRKELEAKTTEIESLKSELKAAKDLAEEQKALAAQKENQAAAPAQSGGAKSAGKVKSIAGLVYKVQIGAFRNKDLTKYFENNPNFSGEIDADGIKKYTLGIFQEYWEADQFKKYLREMGVNDAWIVAYKDGKRVDMRDAREGAI
jgi:thiol:disulfide interchange protein